MTKAFNYISKLIENSNSIVKNLNILTLNDLNVMRGEVNNVDFHLNFFYEKNLYCSNLPSIEANIKGFEIKIHPKSKPISILKILLDENELEEAKRLFYEKERAIKTKLDSKKSEEAVKILSKYLD